MILRLVTAQEAAEPATYEVCIPLMAGCHHRLSEGVPHLNSTP